MEDVINVIVETKITEWILFILMCAWMVLGLIYIWVWDYYFDNYAFRPDNPFRGFRRDIRLNIGRRINESE